MDSTTAYDTSLHDVDIDNVQYTHLPRHFFPEYWKDDTRMAVLFAPFRQRDVNPINYDNKMQIWIQLILKYCEFKGSASVSLAELRLAFKRDNKKSYALQKVLDELKNTGKLQTAQSFLEPPQHTWGGWAVRHISKAITWPLLVVKARIMQQTDSTQQSFVLLDAVKKQADKLQQNCSVNKIMSMEVLMENLQESGLTADGAEFALHYLWSQRRADVVSHTTTTDQQLILLKICAANESYCCITEKERNLYDFTDSLNKQKQLVHDLEEQINTETAKVRDHLLSNQKDLAKMHLKRKHALMNKFSKNAEILGNLENLISGIQDAKHNAIIMQTYKAASNELKKSYEESGLTAEVADDTLAEIQEVMQEHQEIIDIVGTSRFEGSFSVSDESALEDELREILNIEDKKAKDDRNLDESIERRLRELNISSIADLSPAAQRRVVEGSNGSVRDLPVLQVQPSPRPASQTPI